MVVLTLLVAAVVDSAIAGVLAGVGRVFHGAAASVDARRALASFRLWWFGLAFTVFANASKEAVAAFGAHTSPFAVVILNAMSYAFILATCAAVAGLLYYLTYLVTGRRGAFVPIVAFYAAYTVVALALVARMAPAGVTPGKWFVQWAFLHPTSGGPLLAVLTLLLLLPQIAAGIAYLVLRRRLDEPLARYRTGLIGWALVLWLGLALVAPFVQLGRFEAWQAGGRLVAFAAALAIFSAYRPPALVRTRLEAAHWEPHEHVEAEADHQRRRAAAMDAELRARIREIV